MRVLIAGESWITHSVHQKGTDSFTTTEYCEGARWLKEALASEDCHVDHLPAHLVGREFPMTVPELQRYACVILSDIGANTLLVHPDTFTHSKSVPNRLETLRDYVASGGGLVMIGGYMSFQGIEGKARYRSTPVEEVLPVTLLEGDDRVEAPQGLQPAVQRSRHAILNGIEGAWPSLLGLNAVRPRNNAEVLVTAGDHPLLVTCSYGLGRSVAFTSDCSPHWAPPAFLDWIHYPRLWRQIVDWTIAACALGETTASA